MDESPSPAAAPGRAATPNHHASHPGFSGASGLLAAVSFLFGRDTAAQLAVELAQLQVGEHVVDVGCGPGVAARRAHALGAVVIGVDPAPVMLRVARARGGGHRATGVQWRLGTAEALPVESAWAHVVWSLSTVHHWSELDPALDEAARVLAPEGRLVVVERRIADPLAPGAAGHGWTLPQAEAFAEACRAHGFTNVRVGEHTEPHGRRSTLSVVANRAPATA